MWKNFPRVGWKMRSAGICKMRKKLLKNYKLGCFFGRFSVGMSFHIRFVCHMFNDKIYCCRYAVYSHARSPELESWRILPLNHLNPCSRESLGDLVERFREPCFTRYFPFQYRFKRVHTKLCVTKTCYSRPQSSL